MADYDFEAWAQSRVASSKPNPNQQAATSMRSVGIGGLGGRTTTSAAQRIQDQFSMFRDDDRGSTYDFVPQTVTSGLGTPLSFVEKEKKDDRNLDQKIYDGMKAFGARLFPPKKESTSDYVLDVYETSPMFRIPTVPEVTELGIEKSFEQKMQEMFSGQGQNVYTPEIEGTGSYDEVPAPSTNKNLMRNRINNILKDVIAPNSKEYEIQKGDTLSDISLREGVRVDDLAQVNEIENPNLILEGGTLIIPPVQEMEKAKEYVLRVTTRGDEITDTQAALRKGLGSKKDMSGIQVASADPDFKFYQSGVPMDQRIFEPELGADAQSVTGYDDVPQKVTGLMSQRGILPDTFTFDTVESAQERLNDLGFVTLVGPLDVDGQLGKGTARQLRKFQATANIPITGKLDAATKKALRNNRNTNKEGKDPTVPLTTLSEGLYQQIKKPIAKIESGNRANPYATIGGDARLYDGKYQFGWRAKTDLRNNPSMTDEEVAKLQQIDPEVFKDLSEEEKARMGPQIEASRAAFRADPNLQEKSFRLYINQNHNTLTKNSAKYRAMDEKNKLAVLGYAHNQGAEAALEWLTTKVVGLDAFGTRGDKYSEAIVKELSKRKAGK